MRNVTIHDLGKDTVNTETMSDLDYLIRFGDMCSDNEIQAVLDRMSEKDKRVAYRQCLWLSEGPPWEGHCIQGTHQYIFCVRRRR